MPLSKELKIASVVIVARNFNPSIFTQEWLIDKNVINKGARDGQQIFTPQFVHVSNNEFRLTVLPEQLIFEVVNSPKDVFIDTVNHKLIPIVNSLDETPLAAVGVNFQWHIFDTDQNIGVLSKKWFDLGTGIFSLFNTSDARYGAYMSRDFLNSRLKLDIKPITEMDNEGHLPREVIVLAFNFHRDLVSSTKHKDLLEVIENGDKFLNESKKTVNTL